MSNSILNDFEPFVADGSPQPMEERKEGSKKGHEDRNLEKTWKEPN